MPTVHAQWYRLERSPGMVSLLTCAVGQEMPELHGYCEWKSVWKPSSFIDRSWLRTSFYIANLLCMYHDLMIHSNVSMSELMGILYSLLSFLFFVVVLNGPHT